MAGFIRGAFYSNVSAKDEIVLALLEGFFERTRVESERLLAEAEDPADFIAAMDSPERQIAFGLEEPGMLYIELVLHALRNPENRPRLIEHQRLVLDQMAGFLTRIAAADGTDIPGGVEDGAMLLSAFDSGLMLHALIDPEATGNTQQRWTRTMLTLHSLWVGGQQPPS